MSELLIKELIYENEYFKNLYRQYKNVLIFKNINKCYTDDRYINFKFVYNIYMNIGALPRRCRPFSFTEKPGQKTTPGIAGALFRLRIMRAGLKTWE